MRDRSTGAESGRARTWRVAATTIALLVAAPLVAAAPVLVTIPALAVVAGPHSVGAQSAPTQSAPPQSALRQSAPVESVALSSDSVEIGDRFDLHLVLRLGAGDVAFFPDSLEGPGVEPFEAVSWTSDSRPNGSTLLTVSYPLLAYQTGPVLVPDFDVFVAPRAEAVAADFAGDSDLVGSWDAFRESPASVASVRLLPVPPQQVMVATVLGLDDITTQITPRPPADLSGGNRDWLSTFLVAVFGVLLVGVTASSTRDWLRLRAMGPPVPPPTPKERALTALDELAASGMHGDGRVRDFYAGWSEVVRRYVEGFEAEWGPAWTSSELMADLQGPRRSLAAERSVGPEEIAGIMRTAEEVKFGGVRPDPETALGDLDHARSWIGGSA